MMSRLRPKSRSIASSAGAGVVFSIARGANADTGSERAVAVLLQQPIGQYEVLDDDGARF